MFTGLVEELGTVRHVQRSGGYQQLTIEAEKVLEDLQLGDSVALNGVCQTVTEIDSRGFSVETLDVSLQKTTLGTLSKGEPVNLERALTPSSRMGGHIVQGHVDGLGRISALRHKGENIYLELILPQDLIGFCVAEGSIAVEGVSLTIAELRGTRITMNIIPTTWNATVFKERKVGDRVNIEVDIMARYAARLLETQFTRKGAKT